MADYVIDTIEHEGKTAEIRHDEYAESPRTSCDNLWTLVSNHRDWSDDEGAELSLQDLMERRKTLERDYVIVNVYAYIHSGIALSLTPLQLSLGQRYRLRCLRQQEGSLQGVRYKDSHRQSQGEGIVRSRWRGRGIFSLDKR